MSQEKGNYDNGLYFGLLKCLPDFATEADVFLAFYRAAVFPQSYLPTVSRLALMRSSPRGLVLGHRAAFASFAPNVAMPR